MATKLIDNVIIGGSEQEAMVDCNTNVGEAVSKNLRESISESHLLVRLARLERENAELLARNEELLHSEQELLLQGTALETAADAVVITDSKGTILWVNPAFTVLTGYLVEDVIGKKPSILKSGLHTPEFYKELWETILAGKTWRGNFTNRRKDGSLYQDEHTITPVRSKEGVVTHFIAILNDVTDRKKVEAALVESERKFRTLFEAANDAIFILESGHYVDCNSRGAELLGLTREQIIGQPVCFQSPTNQPDGAESAAKMGEIRQNVLRGIPQTFEWVAHRSDGTPVYLDCSSRTFELDGKTYTQTIAHDVTERKKTVEQLVWKTTFFEALANSALDGILVVDTDGKKILHNQRMTDLWEVPQELVDENVDKRRFDWVTKKVKNPEQFAQKVAWLYAHPDEISFDELELINGKFLDRYSAPVRGKDGKYYGRIWVFRDVTERKRTEESLKLFRALIEQSNDAIEVIDAETGRFLDVNTQSWQQSGFTREEMLSLKVEDVAIGIPPLAEMVKEIKASGYKITEGRKRRKDGSTFPVEASVRYINQGHAYLVAVVRDISDRKQAEEKIAEQAAFLDKARDGIVVRDLEGKVLYWNKGAERVHGWTSEEVVGRNISEMLYSDHNDFKRVHNEILNNGEWAGEVVHLTKDGREVVVEVRGTLIRDNEGRPKSTFAINTDITQKKQIEAQFMRAQRMESIGTLAGGIAHDLNNILSPIMLSIAALQEMSDNPQTESMLQTIATSAKRGAEIVRQVLSFTRGVEGERVAIESKDLLKDVEDIIKHTFPKDIRLKFTVSDDTWKILGDATQVHQALLNLCLNARDAMPHGGGLTVEAENCVLDDQYAAMNVQAKAGRYVKVAVGDTGGGISPEIIDKIFEPFFTTKALDEGTGLGLSTVMAIVKSHGGSTSVSSALGKGTTFNIYLPAMETAAAAREEPVEPATSLRGWGETILVVDDEASILTTTTKALQIFGYRVLTASDGADAVSVYVEHQEEIDLVLADMLMPIMDGPAMIHALMEIDPLVKIVAVSGQNESNSATKSTIPGVKYLLPKPYTSATLLKTLRQILDQA